MACILAFPFAQRKSYGKFLIRFSYELSRKEQKLGSPEKPLSDLGAVSYRSYWSFVILTELNQYSESTISIADLCYSTSMLPDDVIATLQYLNILIEEPDGSFAIYIPLQQMQALLEKYKQKGIQFDSSKLQWIPLYVVDPSIDKWSIEFHKSKGCLQPNTMKQSPAPVVHTKLPLKKEDAEAIEVVDEDDANDVELMDINFADDSSQEAEPDVFIE